MTGGFLLTTRQLYVIISITMITRHLKDYNWTYENGIVGLLNKKTGDEIKIAIEKIDSLSRACIAFRNRFRIEQNRKTRTLIMKQVYSLRQKLAKIKSIKTNGT